MKKFQTITQSKLKEKGVQALANRPNEASRYGIGGLSAQDLKKHFDALAIYLAQEINRLYALINGTYKDENDISGNITEYIDLSAALKKGASFTLDDLLRSIQNGSFAEDILKVKSSGADPKLLSLFEHLTNIAKEISDLKENYEILAGYETFANAAAAAAQEAKAAAETESEKAATAAAAAQEAAESALDQANEAKESADKAAESEAMALSQACYAQDQRIKAESAYHEIHGEILKSMYGSEDGAILYIPDKGYAYNLESGVTGHNSGTLRALFFRDSQVHQINGHTFNGCSKLSYIDKFPSTLYDIHGSCFAYCGFSSIEIDCVNIQNRAFRNNPNLTKVVISDRVQQIFEFAFFECRKLDYVKIGCGVKSIGTGVFKNCMTDGSWHPLVIDMTAFTDGIAFPTLVDWDSFPSTAEIQVVKGRKAVLASKPNWSVWSHAMVEV